MNEVNEVEVLYVLRHLLDLKCGVNPDPEWTETEAHKPFSQKALFIQHAERAAEVERRLNMCGLDGFLVKLVFAYQENYETIITSLQSAGVTLSPKLIDKKIKRALWYVTGRWPKKPYKPLAHY